MREVEHPNDPLVAELVEDGAVFATRLDEATPAQTGEMVRHFRLGDPEPFHELADRQLALRSEQLEDPEPDRIAEATEVLRDEVGLGRGIRQTERRSGTHQALTISAALDMTPTALARPSAVGARASSPAPQPRGPGRSCVCR